MRKFLISFILVFFCILFTNTQVQAAEASSDGGWDDMLEFDRSWQTNHKPITDAEFEKVMQRYEKKKKTKKYEFDIDEARDSLNDMSILNEIENHSPIILFPLNLRSYEGEYIPAGYYKLNYMGKNKKHYIVISQGRKIYATLEMVPTNENFKSESIQFAELRPYNDEMMELIYGNLDLNLEKKLFIIN